MTPEMRQQIDSSATEMLREAGKGATIYGYHFEWCGAVVSAHWFYSEAESMASLGRALRSIGWTRPKWWEFWRWGEILPPEAAVQAAITATSVDVTLKNNNKGSEQ